MFGFLVSVLRTFVVRASPYIAEVVAMEIRELERRVVLFVVENDQAFQKGCENCSRGDLAKFKWRKWSDKIEKIPINR